LVNASLQKQLEINDWTHENGVHFIAAGTHGLFGYVNCVFLFIVTHGCISYAFNDFGSKFTCVDPTGEQPLSGMIVSVEKVCDLLEFFHTLHLISGA
jgi:ubiquitin-activating enzyme E1